MSSASYDRNPNYGTRKPKPPRKAGHAKSQHTSTPMPISAKDVRRKQVRAMAARLAELPFP